MKNNRNVSDQDQFEKLVSSMNLPKERKAYKPENVRWFLRNGAILNTTHKHFHAACALAQKLA